MQVLIVDDHPSVLEGLRALITSEFHVTNFRGARTSEEAIALAASNPWTLIITDLSVPGRDGAELVSELARLAPNARILVHTVHAESQFGVRVLMAGAHGYVTKDQSLETLLSAVRRVLEGRRFISAELADELFEALHRGTREGPGLLSDREIQVLKLLARGKSPTEMGESLHISAKTVSTYRARLLEKLRLSTNADLVRYAIEQKLID